MNGDHADPAEVAALRRAFGVDDGGASALGPKAVRAFEAAHGIVLPEPYRTFVAEVTDGSYQGPPEYGMAGLLDGAAGKRLAEPFPLTEAWLWEEDEGPHEDPGAVIEQVTGHGSLRLGTDGCGMDWHLVVTGPHRGHIWLITGEGAVPFGAPFGHTTAEPGFAGWVRHWADGREWFDAPAAQR